VRWSRLTLANLKRSSAVKRRRDVMVRGGAGSRVPGDAAAATVGAVRSLHCSLDSSFSLGVRGPLNTRTKISFFGFRPTTSRLRCHGRRGTARAPCPARGGVRPVCLRAARWRPGGSCPARVALPSAFCGSPNKGRTVRARGAAGRRRARAREGRGHRQALAGRGVAYVCVRYSRSGPRHAPASPSLIPAQPGSLQPLVDAT